MFVEKAYGSHSDYGDCLYGQIESQFSSDDYQGVGNVELRSEHYHDGGGCEQGGDNEVWLESF